MKIKLTEQYLYYMGKKIEKGGKFSTIETQMLALDQNNNLIVEKSTLSKKVEIYYFRKELTSGNKSSITIPLIKDYDFTEVK